MMWRKIFEKQLPHQRYMHRIRIHENRIFGFAVFLLLYAVCLMPAVYAQNTGGLKGKVRTMRGDGIAGATIAARQKGVDIKTGKSDGKGAFVLDGLEPGIYNVVFDAKGYSSGVRYGVEIKKNKIIDLGDRLILTVDRGMQVIIRGSVFFKEGTSASDVKVEIQKVNADGSVRKLGETMTNYLGEFGFSQPEGAAKLRFKATYKGGTGTKDLDVDSAEIYRLAIRLDIPRKDE